PRARRICDGMKTWLLALFVVMGCSGGAGSSPAASGTNTPNTPSAAVDPVKAVGPFHLGMTRSEAEKLVKPDEFGEGSTNGRSSFSVYFMEPEKRITMFEDAGGKVTEISLHGDTSTWYIAHGISIGTKLSALVKANGRPLRVHGFGSSEKSGQIVDWQGGALAKEF